MKNIIIYDRVLDSFDDSLDNSFEKCHKYKYFSIHIRNNDGKRIFFL